MAFKAHIIHVIADAGPGGAPQHVVSLLKGLKNVAPDAYRTLIAPAGWITDAAKGWATVIPAPLISAVRRGSHQAFRAALAKAAKSAPNQPALVHFHGVRAGTLGYLHFRYHGRRSRLPMVYTEHLWTRDYHLPNRLRELLQLRLLAGVGHHASRVIAVSEAVRTFLLERKLAPPDRMVVIHNGVALPQRIANSEQRTGKRMARSTRAAIGSIGALVPLKGYDTLIEAMPLVVQNVPEITLTIVGDGPEKARLMKLADRYHLHERVRWVGQASDPAAEFAGWDLYVSASQSESFGLAIAEAMAAGVAVVATAVGGVPELVTPETGRLVPPRDPSMLAKTIIDLLGQPKLRARLRSAARTRIEKHFTIEQMVQKTVGVYADVLKINSKQSKIPLG